jgi:hypothetical protein
METFEMATKSLNISLPEDLKIRATELAIEKKHGSIGRYIQHLLRRESEKDEERKKLEALLTQGRKSGISNTKPETFFKTLRKQLK